MSTDAYNIDDFSCYRLSDDTIGGYFIGNNRSLLPITVAKNLEIKNNHYEDLLLFKTRDEAELFIKNKLPKILAMRKACE